MPSIRIFWVDDSSEFMAFAQALLQVFPRLEVVGTAPSAEAALQTIANLQPDLVLMDLCMAGMTGLEATRRLKAGPNPPRVVLVTGSDTPEYRRAALAAGADGFLAKPDLMHCLMPLIEDLFASFQPERLQQ
jgi:DNA-binding NarL/FixJ family response regulator